MADQLRWFKLWTSASDDPHLDSLPIADFGRWCKLGAYTKKHGIKGVLKIIPPARTLCAKFQVENCNELLQIISHFPNIELQKNCNGTCVTDCNATVTLVWRNWDKYQGDNSLERVRKYREKTLKNIKFCNAIKRRGEERRREEIIKEKKVIKEKKDIKTETAWLESLKQNPAYQGLDIEKELHKCLAYFEAIGKTVSKQRFLNWINRADKPIQSRGVSKYQRGAKEFIEELRGEDAQIGT